MKRFQFCIFFLSLALFGAFFTGNVQAVGNTETPVPRGLTDTLPEISGPYYEGTGGAGLRLAVLQPEGLGLSTNEQWVLSFIQGDLTGVFAKYSAITVSDRQNLDKALAQGTALNVSKDESIKIGKLINVQYILTGSLRKISDAEFLFQLAVTNTETGVRKASYSKTTAAEQLRDAAVLRDAAEDLLAQMGVVLTAAGKQALHRTGTRELEAAVALARGITAQKNGNTIETLSYFYNAVSYDASLPEAAGRLESLSAMVSSGGLGESIKTDIEARDKWKKILDEFEIFYSEHPPFELAFVPGPTQRGVTDYEAAGGATADLQFKVTLRESPELNGMRQVLKNIHDGLEQTKNKETWGFANWPYQSALFNGSKDYAVSAELLDDNGTVIKLIKFDLFGRLFLMREKIFPDSTQNRQMVFTSVKVDSLTVNPQVKITSVNGINADRSGQDGYIRIVPLDEMPAAYPRNLLVLVTRDILNSR
jgi:hypothetical protein